MPASSDRWLPFVGAIALWAPAMIAASYVWGHGEYYDYGWFVPPAAGYLAWLRWRETPGEVRLLRKRTAIAAAVLLFPWVLALRVLGNVDPGWRLPIGLLGLTAAAGGHAIVGRTRGWRVSAGFGWITLLALSAMPWPSVVEAGIVRRLTDGVVTAVAELFQIFGKPVEVLGDRLRLNDITVEVTDGCSGVRSFQSFVMATWFFAEVHRLRAARALVLLVCACGSAFFVNACRTYTLAAIRFDLGEAAFHRAHDWLGLAAFAVSGLAFYFLSSSLAAPVRRAVVRRVRQP
jgi:exosortase